MQGRAISIGLRMTLAALAALGLAACGSSSNSKPKPVAKTATTTAATSSPKCTGSPVHVLVTYGTLGYCMPGSPTIAETIAADYPASGIYSTGGNISDVHCVRLGRGRYSCTARYVTQDGDARTVTFEVRALVACSADGSCRWHVVGTPQGVGLPESDRNKPTTTASTPPPPPKTTRPKPKSSPPPATSGLTNLASGHASGDYAIAQTTATANNPSGIELQIQATPSQWGRVTWEVVCQEVGGGAGSKNGQSTRSLPTVEMLSLPAPSTSCIVSANVQISGSGSAVISIYG